MTTVLAYATLTDMVNRFGEVEMIQLTDVENTGSVNADAVGRALDDAQAFADTQLGLVYQLPLLGCALPPTSPGADPVYVVPPVLKRMVCDLARYYLMPNLDEKHAAALRVADVRKDLKAIAEGKAQLTCPWGGVGGVPLQIDPVSDNQVQHSFAPRQLNDDSLRGFA